MNKSNQIESFILEGIESGIFSPGDKIYSEKELCSKFEVSKMTVNRVITKLNTKGILKSVRGSGIYVMDTSMGKEITKLTSFSEDLENIGLKPITKLISFSTTTDVDKVIKEKLSVSDNTLVHVIVRQRLNEGKPFAVDVAYLNSKIVNLIDQSKLEGSLYEYLEKEKKIVISHANQNIYVGYANKQVAELLDIKSSSCVLEIEHTTYNDENIAFEYVKTYYHPNKYSFNVISYR